MIKITKSPLSPDAAVDMVRSAASGCVVTYVGLIRGDSHGKEVLSVEYTDREGRAEDRLMEIAVEIRRKFQVNGVAIHHRTGRLSVGDINLVVAIAAAHRGEGFAASQYAIDRFKEALPTLKKETYTDGSVFEGD